VAQSIVRDFPPNYDEIANAFRIAHRRDVIFSFGAVIYNPFGVRIGAHLFAHEAVHGERQRGHVEEWWRRYIDDARFRLAEEIPAHQAEYRWFLANGNRAQRRAARTQIATRLASPLYGRLIGRSAAEAMLAA